MDSRGQSTSLTHLHPAQEWGRAFSCPKGHTAINNLMRAAAPGEPTMSSIEIADLLEKRHDNVKRTIEALATKQVIGLVSV